MTDAALFHRCPPCPTELAISFACPASLQALEVGVPIASLFTATASAGAGSVTWSVTGGSPAGVTIDHTSGAVSVAPASPVAAGSGSSFTLVATDGDFATAQQPCYYAVAAGAWRAAARAGTRRGGAFAVHGVAADAPRAPSSRPQRWPCPRARPSRSRLA